MTSTRVSPPNSVVLLMDAGGGVVPKTMAGSVIAATETCIAVGCKSEDDGNTELTLGSVQQVGLKERPTFEGRIATPSRRIVIKNVLGEYLLEEMVLNDESTLRIWLNDPMEPDKIVVGIA